MTAGPIGEAPRTRRSARLLVIADDGTALLFFERANPRSTRPPRWCTPGGGIEQGESVREAAIRELREEVGLCVADPGGPVAEIEIEVSDDSVAHSRAHGTYFVIRVPEPFEPSDAGWTDDERQTILRWRWWSAGELEASGEPCWPPQIPRLIRAHS